MVSKSAPEPHVPNKHGGMSLPHAVHFKHAPSIGQGFNKASGQKGKRHNAANASSNDEGENLVHDKSVHNKIVQNDNGKMADNIRPKNHQKNNSQRKFVSNRHASNRHKANGNKANGHKVNGNGKTHAQTGTHSRKGDGQEQRPNTAEQKRRNSQWRDRQFDGQSKNAQNYHAQNKNTQAKFSQGKGRKRPQRHVQNNVRKNGNGQSAPAVKNSVGQNSAANGYTKTIAKGFDGKSQSWNTRRAYAAIDLGTNNCRLLIAKPAQKGFIVVDAFSRVVCLGEGLGKTGSLSTKAMDRAVAALSICADKLRRRHVCLARSVATEACRKADNGDEFIQRVYEETGICLDVISAQEEARLAVLGCHILLEPGQGPALIFDIGGGSTELVLVDTDGTVPEILDWVSIPWGVVTLTESQQYDDEDPLQRKIAYAEMRGRVLDSFTEFAGRLPHAQGDVHRLLGASGTVTTLASLHLDLPCYNRNAVDGLIVELQSMRNISQQLANYSLDERSDLPCIGRDRAKMVVAGCAILESILDIWPAERLGVADRGIREGILRSLMVNEHIGAR